MFFGRLWCVLGVLRLASGSVVAQIPDPDGDLHVYALPIGQGDATVIQCPKGTGGLTVFDIGSTKFKGFMTRSDVSRWLGTQQVDAIFLSHPHVDHYNFIDALSGNLKSEGIAIFHACNASSYKKLPSLTAGWNASLVRVTRCVANDRSCETRLPPCRNYTICGGRGVLRVLASELNNCITDPNENSMVLKLEYEGTSFLLPGDLEDYYANYNNHGVPTPEPDGPYGILLSCCDVESTAMRIAHHGAYGRANKPGLHYHVNPQIALSSSGFEPSYCHPRCDIYDFYTKWINASANHPLFQPKLQVDYDLKHWYTCGNYPLGIWETKRVKEAIYVTSVCAYNLGAGSGELVNYIVEVNMKNVSGMMPGPTLTQFSAYNSSTFPENYFPC